MGGGQGGGVGADARSGSRRGGLRTVGGGERYGCRGRAQARCRCQAFVRHAGRQRGSEEAQGSVEGPCSGEESAAKAAYEDMGAVAAGARARARGGFMQIFRKAGANKQNTTT